MKSKGAGKTALQVDVPSLILAQTFGVSERTVGTFSLAKLNGITAAVRGIIFTAPQCCRLDGGRFIALTKPVYLNLCLLRTRVSFEKFNIAYLL